ncbi:MAG: hypothetical protein WC209_00255 [Ignavibacteriaceae bacterium]
MMSPKLKAIAKENHWHFCKNSVFGLFNESYFQIDDGHGFKKMTSYYNEITEETRQTLLNNLLENKNELKIKEVTVKLNSLSLTFSERFLSVKKETLKAVLEFVANLLKANSVLSMNKCSQCNSSDFLEYYFHPTIETSKMICHTCVEKNENDYSQQERNKMYEEKYYLRGLLGAFLFAMAGIIVWVIIAFYLRQLTSLGAIVLGLLSFHGYKYFKGTMNNKAKWMLFAIIILSIVLANFISVGVDIYAYNHGIDIRDIVLNLFYNDAISSVVKENTLISLALSAIPFYYINNFINTKMNLTKWVLAKKMKA